MKYLLVVILFLNGSALCHGDIVPFPIITEGLESPVGMAAPVDNSDRLFILERDGRIRIYDINQEQLLETPFLDITALITPNSGSSERGLLGIAFHPNYLTNGYFYIHYTDLNGDTAIARYTVSNSDPNLANPASALAILSVEQPRNNHKGGQMGFGPDGYLYIALGDGGGQGDPDGNGQNKLTRLGKILRIDVDNGSPFSIPADNPFVGNADYLPEIWALGLRNPWRFSFDRLTGELYIADVGQNTYEELNHEPTGFGGGANYGWKWKEASHCFTDGCESIPNLTDPIFEYSHPDGGCSITGGYVYRGSQIPSLYGKYIYADFCMGRLQALELQNGVVLSNTLLHSGLSQVTSFGEDQEGNLYVMELGGTVYKIVDDGNSAASGKKYQGLLYSEDDHIKGIFTLTFSAKKAFTAKFFYDNKYHVFKGKLGSNSRFEGEVPRKGLSSLLVSVQLNLFGTPEIEAIIIDGVNSFTAFAQNVPKFTTAPLSLGNHTAALDAITPHPNAPKSPGYGFINVAKNGVLKFVGALADGTKFSSTASLFSDNSFPLFIPLYSYAGFVGGMADYNIATDFAGQLEWTKPSLPKSKYYPLAFSTDLSLRSSVFNPKLANSRLLNLFLANVELSESDTITEKTWYAALLTNHKFEIYTTEPGEKFSLSISRSNGKITGRYIASTGARPLLVQGVILQDENAGAGFFLDLSLSGIFELTEFDLDE